MTAETAEARWGKRPSGIKSALVHATIDKAAFNQKWQQSKFHCNTDPATRALIASIHDQYGRLVEVLDKQEQAQREKDEDKEFALLAHAMADPDANTDLGLD